LKRNQSKSAKMIYRCRNNSAYDSFSKEVFKDIVELIREKPEHLEFEVLRVI